MSSLERSAGLVLRTYPFSETSLIVRWLTPDLGRLDTVAKGARRPKSPLRGKLDLFYLADFSFRRSRRSELHTLCEVVLRDTREALRRDLSRLRQASYCAALIEQTTEKETPLPGLYALLTDLLAHLTRHPARPRTVYAFELRLLRELGLEPDRTKSRLSSEGRQLLQSLAEAGWDDLAELSASAEQAAQLRQFLHGFLAYHLGRVPAGRNAALDVSARVEISR